jgi:carboxyl-terminal processing protease
MFLPISNKQKQTFSIFFNLCPIAIESAGAILLTGYYRLWPSRLIEQGQAVIFKFNLFRNTSSTMKTFYLTSIFFLTFVALSAKAIEPNNKLETIAKITATMISSQHYTKHQLDDEISRELFKEYFKVLDPNKMYFTKQDIKKFDDYREQLDDYLYNNNISFAFYAYNKLLRRLNEYQKYTDSLLKKGFDFNKQENFEIDRSKAEWPENEAELKELWRKRTKNEILTLKLMDRAAKEEEKNEKTKTKVHTSWKQKKPEERIRKRIAQFVKHLNENEPIDVLELYLSSLARVYDPHSSYMSPQTEEDFNIQMKLSLVGIGALLSSEDGYTKIVRIIPGGPADRDKRLKAEDRIIAVAQENAEPVDIIDMPLNKVVKMIRGPKDTEVRLTILEGSKGMNAIPKDISLKRDVVRLKEQEASGEIKEIEGPAGKKMKIGVITLSSFYMDFDAYFNGDPNYKSSSCDVKKILDNFNKQKVDGVILDLRSNGGGSLREAITLSGLFIKYGPVVQVKSNSAAPEIQSDQDSAIYYDGPLLVLLNKLSASASEIFAGAMKDYQRALIVGDTHTHGKGTVQTIYNLEQFLTYMGAKFPAGSLKYTNAKFYRINGASTQLKGVQADINFPSFTDSMKIGEKDLDHALPWDTIDAVNHDYYYPKLPQIIPELKKQSVERRNNNKKFQALKKYIETFNQLKERKLISLNEKERWDEYLKEKKIHDEQSKLLKLEQDQDDKDKKEKSDIYLDESLNIMGDFIKLNNSSNVKQTVKKDSEPIKK